MRVVAATNQTLETSVKAGTFRRDLFFRLQVVEISVPPLRERKSDVPELAEHFLKRFVRETGRKIRGFTPSALKKMEEYHWPGNVRELRNVVERAVALGLGPMLDVSDIWLSSLSGGALWIDIVGLPVDLVTDATPDAIPYPWVDAVPFLAAYYAYMAFQRQADANMFMERYREIMRRIRSGVTSTALPVNEPGGVGAMIATGKSPLGAPPPQTGARQGQRGGGGG